MLRTTSNRRSQLRPLQLGALLAPAVLGLLMVPSAGAYVVSFSNSVPLTGLNWGPTSVPLNQFSVPGAFLTHVELDLSATLRMDIAIENNGAVSSAVSYSQGAPTTFSYPVSLNTILTPTISLTTATLAPYDGLLDGAGASGVTYDNATSTSTQTVTIPGASWSAYTGAGNFNVDIASILGTSVVSETGKSTWHDYNEALASAVVTVRYTYQLFSEVPEGEALWAGIGVTAILLGRRWRTRHQPDLSIAATH